MSTPVDWSKEAEKLLSAFKESGGVVNETPHPIDDFITDDDAMIKLKSKVRLLSQPLHAHRVVLIQGPSGTGKELIAKGLHGLAPKDTPFIPFNCAAMPDTIASSILQGHRAGTFTGATADKKGIFEAASSNSTSQFTNTGTVFLDEINSMPMSQQAILLRIIQSREVLPIGSSTPVKINCRIVLATNQDLYSLVQQGQFRGDLYARIMGIKLIVTPLTSRINDAIKIAHKLGLPEHFNQTHIDHELLKHYGVRYIQSLYDNYYVFQELNEVSGTLRASVVEEPV